MGKSTREKPRTRSNPQMNADQQIGDERNFLFTVQAYTPPFIRCTNTPPARRPVTASCQTILNTMKASDAKTAFGAVGVPDVDESLPQVLTDREGLS